MASGAASSRSASQFATGASAHDVDAWEKEEELAATRRAVNALWNVPIGVGDNALWEVLRDVHFLLVLRDLLTGWSLGGDHEASFPKRSGEDAIGSGACGQVHRTFSFGRR